MRIVVSHRHALICPDTAPWIARHVLLALSRFSPKIVRVTVTLETPDFPATGREVICRLTVRLLSGRRLTVRGQDSDTAQAVETAVARAGSRVALSLSGSAPRSVGQGGLP